MTTILLCAVVGFLAAWMGTRKVRSYAIARSMMDVPNERSSHAVAVPRGGGLAIAGVVLTGVAVLGALGEIPPRTCAAILGGGVAVAGVGWIDDRGHVRARWRAAVHFVAAAWAVYWIGGMPILEVGGARLLLGSVGSMIAVVGTVWLINLYNFMDGIDGIAGGEALSVGLAGAVLLWLNGSPGLSAVSVLVAAAGAGFLMLNWHPASVFMGDVGSGLLGFLFAVLAVASEATGAVPAVLWILLLGVFVFDATVTLLRRVARGERWYDAHRTHAYQRAVQHGMSHAQVVQLVLAINVALGTLVLVADARPRYWLLCAAAGVFLLTAVFLLVGWLDRMRTVGVRQSAGSN